MKGFHRVFFAVLAMAAFLLLVLPPPPPQDSSIATTKCNRETLDSLLKGNATDPFYLTCSLTFPKNVRLHRSIVLEGSAASNVTLDCRGGLIDKSDARDGEGKIAVIVRSRETRVGEWDRPQNVTVQNCLIKGVIRVYGLNMSANGENMRKSSFRRGHIEFVRASSPMGTVFLNLSIIAPGGAPLYIGPGSTMTRLERSRLSGVTGGTAIYIDAESAGNIVRNNKFSISTRGRELIAIDGSTRNEIVGNTFDDPVNGGIFIYRNCGEGGTIRHQRPELNVVSKNRFVYRHDRESPKPAVWIGSRQGRQKVCFKNPRYPFGSSLSPLDFAQKNTVSGNHLVGGSTNLIRDSDKLNVIRGNISE